MVSFLVRGSQIRAARAMLKWGVRDLAKSADVTPNTVSRIEADENAFLGTVQKLTDALEAEGIEFLQQGENYGPGVRWREAQDPFPHLRKKE